MPLKAIAFDWGHTLMDERRDEHIPLDTRPVHLMPGVADVLPQLTLQLALWANTRVARETDPANHFTIPLSKRTLAATPTKGQGKVAG
jgi:hypothetical protein